MKNISIQYQDLQEGKMNRHQFLRNARMMFPNHVTQFNSFEDSVKILKSKGLLNEGDAVQGTPDKAPTYKYPNEATKYKKVEQSPEVDEQDGIYPATTLTDIPKEKMDKKVKDKSDGLEPIKDKDTKNEMKKVKIVKENVEGKQLKAFFKGGKIEDVNVDSFIKKIEDKGSKLVKKYTIDDEDIMFMGKPRTWMVGMPKFDNLIGPMKDGENVVRYEDEEVYNFLSTESLDSRKQKLRETIKGIVRKALAEYEIGDEEDMAPNEASAISRIVDKFIDHANQTNIRRDLSTKADVERVFTAFEDEVGKRYSDDVFDNVMDALKNKGYKIK